MMGDLSCCSVGIFQCGLAAASASRPCAGARTAPGLAACGRPVFARPCDVARVLTRRPPPSKPHGAGLWREGEQVWRVSAEAAVHVIGASGRSGLAAVPRPGRATGWRSCRWCAMRRNGARAVSRPRRRGADLTDAAALRAALRGATRIVSCAHARFAPAVLAAAPPDARYVFLGSTRKFTRWPDAHGRGVQAGEAAFLASGRAGVMLHPTMIYGARARTTCSALPRCCAGCRSCRCPAAGARWCSRSTRTT